MPVGTFVVNVAIRHSPPVGLITILNWYRPGLTVFGTVQFI